jgi:hypothetical protein
MATENEEYIGYIQYCGKLVDNGLLDARKSAQALLGFDEAIRFFVGCQNPEFKEIDFELPVRIRQGSWEALIPDVIFWLKAAAGTALTGALTAYSIKAAQKMAENDFSNVGLKTIIIKSIESIQWVIRIGKHLGTLSIKKFKGVKFRNENSEIGLPNAEGEYLWVPKAYLDLFVKSPKSLLERVTDLVEDERVLIIGLFKKGKEINERVTLPYKCIFASKDEDDMLFPELKHGMKVTLEGEVAKGNKSSNSIGFIYEGYTLTAYPATGSVVRYKPSLFVNARITGTINRIEDGGGTVARKPKIIFTDIVPLEGSSKNLPLFDDDEA